MKKRTLAIVLCALLICTVLPTAFADAPTLSFQQTWKASGAATTPNEDIALNITADASNPDPQKLITLTKGNDGSVSVSYPEYEAVGVYKYAITQTAGGAQGASYDSGTIGIEVLVTFDADNRPAVTQAGLTMAGGAKKDKFENAYAAGSLTVTHSITGNTGDKARLFPVTVTLHADKNVLTDIPYVVNGTDSQTIAKGWTGDKTVTVSLKDNNSIAFSEIPDGVTYSVTAVKDTYEQTIENEEGTIAGEAAASVKITHDSSMNLNTGVSLDILPYVIVLALVVCCLFLLAFRRRREEEEES